MKLKKFEDIKSKIKPVSNNYAPLGADPELFIRRNGKVIGSEKVIKENSLVVEDGVQVELHPRPDTCRDRLNESIRHCLRSMYEMLEGKKCKVSTNVKEDVTKSQYNSLSDKNKQFGCGVSYNVHKLPEIKPVDPSKYLTRTAGGHMHFGKCGVAGFDNVLTNPERVVPVLDIIVGNTCVLLDRDKGNIERRKYYGRAGEYRTPPHGLEYRTLSNFWLRGSPLVSLVFGLSRLAIGIVIKDYDKHLLSLVDMKDIIQAINTNDYDLAKKNFDKYKGFIVKAGNQPNSTFPIKDDETLKFFERIVEDGLDTWFSHDLKHNWFTDHQLIGRGWLSFKNTIEYNERMAKAQKEKEEAERKACNIQSCS